jgi:hypothetical protein
LGMVRTSGDEEGNEGEITAWNQSKITPVGDLCTLIVV